MSQAADHYLNAIEAFYEETNRIDRMIGMIESGEIFDYFLAEDPHGTTGWYWRLEELPEGPEARYLYLLLGLAVAAVGVWGFCQKPTRKDIVPQRKQMVFRQKYWLFYFLTFMAGARRQIFMAFAVLLMNAAVPLINRWSIPAPLGHEARAVPADGEVATQDIGVAR